MKRRFTPHRRSLGLLLALVAAIPACKPGDRPSLTIATTWPEARQRELEAAFHTWAGRAIPAPIAWIRLRPGDDPGRAVDHRMAVDLLLGGPASSYRRLAEARALGPIRTGEAPSWATLKPVASSTDGPLLIDDPREDPTSLRLVRSRLAGLPFSAGYADLVRLADGRRIEGESGPAPEPTAWEEGAGMPSTSGHPVLAQDFLRFLVETGRAINPPAATADPRVDGLLAELLGATLVDAGEELRTAWKAVVREGRPGRWERWLTEPPPWPPASVSKMIEVRRRGGEDPAPWLDTLADQLAPDPFVRSWLLASWEGSPRPLDHATLSKLAGAVEGRLADEPRFRAWLRAEWTAWARQRYRRVARGAAGGWPP